MKIIFDKKSSAAITELAQNLFSELPIEQAKKKTVARSLALLKNLAEFAEDDAKIIVSNSKGQCQKIYLKR